MIKVTRQKANDDQQSTQQGRPTASKSNKPQKEYGGPKGKEPTRYGDWEKNGRCIDF